MNHKLLRFCVFAFFFLCSFSAQTQCLYTLKMLDTAGDGWSGSTLTIQSGGNSNAYTLNNINDDGLDSTLTFAVADGAPLLVSFTQGFFFWETSFQIYDNTGVLFFEMNAPPTDTLFNGIGQCVSCGKASGLMLENVWDNRAKLRWQSNQMGPNPAESWRLVYGLQGFSVSAGEGDTLDVMTPKATLLGLQKKTWYEAYVQQYCGLAGAYSEFIGPIAFQTYWTNDLGVTRVVAPESGCDLGYDSVKVILKNFGAAPQSLFTFSYSVNGMPANVIPPGDGYFTGVLGKDSSIQVSFGTLSDFSAPGEYRLDVFTQLAADEDWLNDTTTYYFTNQIKPNYTQNFETWDGGWTPNGLFPSWEFGTPDKVAIPAAASGQNAWVTSLSDNYNLSEFSYLESPCFDFSGLAIDPAIECALIHNLLETKDGAWLEMSLDGGQNWEKIGESGEGLNWYTETSQNLGDVWSGGKADWVTARHSLPNSAGESEVHLRFVLAANATVPLGGLGIDDVRVFKPVAKDLAGLSISTLGETEECGLEADKIRFSFVNLSNQAQAGFKLGYCVNGGTPVIDSIPGSLAIDKHFTHTFLTTFDSRDGVFELKCWTILNGDQVAGNDTVTATLNHLPNPVPFQENFETYTIPPGSWNYNPSSGFSVTNQHNNVSKVLAFNLNSGNTAFAADMPRYGYINQGDSLRLTYRITDFVSQGQTPTILQGGSKVEIQISSDCGDTYEVLYTISGANHIPVLTMKTLKISLDAYAGQAIKIRFHGIWGAGNFWVDLDNINLLACPAEMALSVDVVPATPGQNDGSATVQVGIGNPPYSYEWSNGRTDQTATDLPAAPYIVTVTDAFGCTDVLAFMLGSSAAGEQERLVECALYPNPTSGFSTLRATFSHPLDAQIDILNPLGQRVWYTLLQSTDQVSASVDLSNFPDGVYFLRLSVEGKMWTWKVIKN